MYSWKTPSSSDASKDYTSTVADDGKLLCNCRGWTQKREGKPRYCTHHKDYVRDNCLRVEERGEFVYVVGIAAIATKTTVAAEKARILARLDQPFHLLEKDALIEDVQHRPPLPMNASAMTDPVTGDAFDARYGSGWVQERKLNGHRVVSDIRAGQVTCYSRPRADSKVALVRECPAQILEQLERLPDCVLDGEFVAPTDKSWDVPKYGPQLVYVVFDIIAFEGALTTGMTYDKRRSLLLSILRKLPKGQTAISTVESLAPSWKAIEAIWSNGGEGVIVKRVTSTYKPGHRTADWVKVKQKFAATLEIYGFETGDSGPYSKLLLRDAKGRETKCKSLTNKLLRDIAKNPDLYIGRRVVIAFPGWTDKGYGGPVILDHFAGEGE